MAKIINIEENRIDFSDGTIIHCDHVQDCCEYNYADFAQLDDLARDYDFETSRLCFAAVEGSGFRFGDSPLRMFFVPCYSSQNGYYSSDIDVYLNGVLQCSLECEEDFCQELTSPTRGHGQKKFEKLFKNLLTNDSKYVIIKTQRKREQPLQKKGNML